MPPPITICITAFYEELKIRRALESAKACSWCSELLVFDSGSTDRTVEICREYTDRVEFHEWIDYSTSKRNMTEAASNDWVFILDADEEISPELAEEIGGLSESTFQNHPVMTMPRKNWLLGEYVGCWYPDRQNRLIDRRRVEWPFRAVHDFRVPTEGTTLDLKHPLFHNREVDDWSDYFDGRRFENRAIGIAQEMYDRGQRVGFWNMAFRPLFAMIKYYVFKGGFLQGAFGLMVAQQCTLGVQLKYARLWYLQQLEAQGRSVDGDGP
ncbi:MAG: glycosyltransferase family 2 protein [Phycisphaeraceae bacterium]|nr:glycosyltransferase family 2 protein [Phycisphaeraceae bacterium]